MKNLEINYNDKKILKRSAEIINKLCNEIIDNNCRSISCDSPIICGYTPIDLKRLALTIISIADCNKLNEN